MVEEHLHSTTKTEKCRGKKMSSLGNKLRIILWPNPSYALQLYHCTCFLCRPYFFLFPYLRREAKLFSERRPCTQLVKSLSDKGLSEFPKEKDSLAGMISQSITLGNA